MTPLDRVIVDFGHVSAEAFQGGNFNPGERAVVDVHFAQAFPDATMHIVVTPNDLGVGNSHNAALIGVVGNVTANGFRLLARSSDCAFGRGGFNWLAVMEAPQQPQRSINYDLKMAVLQPLWQEARPVVFLPNCVPGDTHSWLVTFNSPFPPGPVNTPPDVFLTETDNNLQPFYQDNVLQSYNAPLAGTAQVATPAAFRIQARNFDSVSGTGTFNYVALLSMPGTNHVAELEIDSGETGPIQLQNGGTPGDWQTVSVTFHEPFLTPPIVCVTADNGVDLAVNNIFDTGALGVVRGVTPYGFTLVARNSASESPGQPNTTNFHWIAFGCQVGCGGGLQVPIPRPPGGA